MIHIYNRMLLDHEKEIMPFAATWTQEITTLNVSQRESQIPYDIDHITYMWNPKHDTVNLSMKESGT